MSTRSFVGVMHGDKCKAIYVHSDGYLEGVGVTLQKYYDSAKANNLVAMGSCSVLGKNIGEKINFNDYDAVVKNEQCRFYKRDRNEEDCEFNVYNNDKELFEELVEFYYVNKDGVWYVSYGAEWFVLADELAKFRF